MREQIDVTQRIVDAQQHILDTLKRQRALGDVSEGDVATQVAALEQSRATLPPLEKQLAQQRDLLAVLTGRRPDEHIPATFTLASLHLPKELPLSLPGRLVEQRPDVRAAEEAMHAASANVGVALAARLPNIQITATAGSTAEKASSLFDTGTGFWSLGAGLTQPLFEGGTLKHKQRAAEAAYDQAAAQYRGVVLAALQSVADALHAIRADTEALAATERAERAAAHSLSILQQQLSLGDASQSQVLASELLWRQSLLSLAQARATRLSDTTALFQALGGGWWNRHDDSDPSPPHG
ncbi:efflux transporter outer membrane subunit [Luteibacter sp.]|uniref:efflux transporter outer membrane subunit n=1 Tax=Luteibacter sp. TaxID=1886636 RepID=UPI0025C11E49|nr:efflux transporter outer membrane subunit [Luteibacter sp.]